jgi:sporulation integral membrane protein YtvI
MLSPTYRKFLYFLALGLLLWITVRFLLPVLLPFLLGGLLALAAEPLVRFCSQKLRIPRFLSAGLGVGLTLLLLVGLLSLTGALVVKELGSLAQALPDMQETAQSGILLLQDWLLGLAGRLPDAIGNLLSASVLELLGSSSVLLQRLTRQLPNVLKQLLGWLPDGALAMGTGIIAGFMISSRLPRLRQSLAAKIPRSWTDKVQPAIKRVKSTVGRWLQAQLKLSVVTYGIVCAGFLLLGIPYGPAWAVLVAAVDAVPLLGTGTVLLPWACIELLRGQPLQALGLVIIYACAMVTRSILEPRLVGRQIGLDPLLTLLSMYAGYRFFGILGLLFAPVFTAATKSLLQPAE